MKKIISILLALMMVLTLAACGGKTTGQPGGSTPSGSDPKPSESQAPETNPPETKPEETVPPETQPVETEPAETEPTETVPPETKPAETEPPKTEPPKTNPPETEPPKTEPPVTEPPETEPPVTEPPETEPPETEPPVTEPEETEPQGSTPGFVGPGFQFGPGGIITPGGQGGDEPEEEIPVAQADDLVEKLDALCADIVEGSYCAAPRSASEFNNFFNGSVRYTEGLRVAMNHLQMAPPAHIVMLIEVPAGEDAEAFAEALKDDANPRWLVCATAQSVQVKVVGNLVLFVMTNEETADALIAAFNG